MKEQTSPPTMTRCDLSRAGFAIAATACLLMISGALSAQSAESARSRPLTLEQVIDLAKRSYPAIQAAQAQQRAAQGTVGVARTAYLPRTDLLWQTNRATANNIYGLLLPQGVISPITGPVIGTDVSRSAWSSGGGALLSWQPFDFGVRAARVNAAQQGTEAAKQAAALASLEGSVGAASAFLDLAAAHQLLTVAEANVRRLETFDKTIHVLVDNSLRPGADASQADAQLALAQNQLVQAQTQEDVRRSALSKYLRPAEEHPEIDASQVLAALPVSDPETTKTTANPAALQESFLIKQQDAQKRALDRSYVPVFNTLGAVSGRGAGTDPNGQFPGGTAGLLPDTFNWAAGVQVTFSVFDYFGLREQKKVQQANTQAEQARYNQVSDEISVAVEQARATLAGARKIAANTPIELSAAQASEQQQQARYRSSLATVVDVATTEGLLSQAEADDAIARLSVWRAELGVAAAQGDLAPFVQLLKSQP